LLSQYESLIEILAKIMPFAESIIETVSAILEEDFYE